MPSPSAFGLGLSRLSTIYRIDKTINPTPDPKAKAASDVGSDPKNDEKPTTKQNRLQ